MDLIHRALKFLDYNRGPVIGIAVAIVVGVWLFGCQAMTTSLLDPNRQVNAAALEREILTARHALEQHGAALQTDVEAHNRDVEAFNGRAEQAREHIVIQVEQQRQIVEALGGIAIGAADHTLTPAGIVGSLVTLISGGIAVGAVYGNVKKSRVIKELKNGGTATATAPKPEAAT